MLKRLNAYNKNWIECVNVAQIKYRITPSSNKQTSTFTQ